MMKKFISLLGSVAIVLTMMSAYTFGVEAAVEKPTFTLEFAGFTTAGAGPTYFANIDVWAELPGTLTPYTVIEADWENTFEDTYEGRMAQTIQANVDLGTGFATYVSSKSSANSAEVAGLQLTKNTSINQMVFSAAYTGAYNTYYAGASKVKLGTIAYRITDLDNPNTVSLTTGQATIYEIAEDGTATPHIYAMSDSNIVLGSSVVVPAVNAASEDFEAVIDENGIVSFNNVEQSSETPSAILDTHEVKVFSNKFEGVTAKTRFQITHNGETKKFGATLGEYFSISGDGTVTGTLGVAVLFPKGDTNDFEITRIDEDE